MSARHRHMKERIREAEAEMQRLGALRVAYATVSFHSDSLGNESFSDMLPDCIYKIVVQYHAARAQVETLRRELATL